MSFPNNKNEAVGGLTLAEIAWVQANAALSPAYNETPTGAIDGVNLSYTLSHTPASYWPFLLYYQGILLIENVDYTRSGTGITMTTALYPPSEGSAVLKAFYKY